MNASLEMGSTVSSNPSGSWFLRSDAQLLGFSSTIPFVLKRPTTKSTGFGIAALVSTKSFLGDQSAVPMTNLRSMFIKLAW